MYKKYIKIGLIFILIFFVNINFSLAATGPLKNYESLREQTDRAADDAGFQIGGFTAGEGVGVIAAVIIKAFLGLLGIIFLVLMIYGGYVWMMARGNEQEAERAKNIMQRAVIGLIIIIGAYAITAFVFSGLEKAIQ